MCTFSQHKIYLQLEFDCMIWNKILILPNEVCYSNYYAFNIEVWSGQNKIYGKMKFYYYIYDVPNVNIPNQLCLFFIISIIVF